MINKDLSINEELCISCGACKLSCDIENSGDGCISMNEQDNYRFIPNIDRSKCKKCFKCYSVCPIQLNRMKNSIEKNSFNDNDKKCFVGYSTDSEHRKNAATAGIATQIVIDSLNNKSIDAAIMTKGTSDGQFEIVLARTEDEVRNCRGSVYRPVNLLANIKEYITNEDIKKIAIVGLPCHIHGIKNVCNLDESIKSKIAFSIAIFCKQTKEKGYTDFIKYLVGFDDKEWTIKYRGNGWPGYTTIRGNNSNVEKTIVSNSAKLSTLWGLQTFTPLGCFMCSDPLGEIADISLGDAWIKEYMENDNSGTEFILANTDNGLNILENSINIEKNTTAFENILISQSKDAINFKRSIDKERWNDIKQYSIDKNLNKISKSSDFKFYMDGKIISEKKLFLTMTKKLPSKVLRGFIIGRQKIYSNLYKK